MFKNNEVKKLLWLEIIIVLIVLVVSIIFYNITFDNYKKHLIYNNSNIIGNVLIKHPELEKDIISSITSSSNYEYGLKILSKYGLDDIDSIEYLNDMDDLKKNILKYNILYVLIIGIVIIIINFIFINFIYRKIKDLNNYLNDVLMGNYNLDIIDYKEGDISNLKNDIYKITTRLKNQADDLRNDKIYLEEVLSDISHQMKTPLTSMYVINDILSEDKVDTKIKKEMLIKNRIQLQRMEWLVSSLLKMSRLDSGSVILKKNNVLVKDLIDKALIPLKIPIELKKIDLQIKVDNSTINVDHNWTVEALVNIIKNAYEHTLEGGLIIIEGTNNPLYTSITITNTGKTIPKKELPNLFKRFYKGNEKKDSIGIGLHMSKKIINKQNGEIEVISKNGKTSFLIKIYKNSI